MPLDGLAPAMAPPAAGHRQQQQLSRSSLAAAAAADLVAAAPAPGIAAVAPPASAPAGNHQHQHSHHQQQRRAGAPVSAPSTIVANSMGAAAAGSGSGTPPMDVAHHHRRTSSAVPPLAQQVGGERKVQLLSRSLSGSQLNAKAPAFVPKGLQIAFSSSLPSQGPVLGFSPPALLQIPSSVIPVITPPPPAAAAAREASGSSSGTGVFVPVAGEEHISEWTPSVEKGPATTDGAGGAEESVDGGEGEQGQGGGGTAVAAPAARAVAVVTEELKAKIVKQVEFYFSDTNLPTDNYLMKFVKKDPEGFVPIPVVASFRKIKNLVKNHGVVAAALRNSTLLVVSEDGKKVRRAEPLPDVDLEEVQSRTVVAENLPAEPSIESLEKLFGKVGTVKMVRICSPEAANGANSTAAKHPKTDMIISNKLHALVEYESVDLAEKAVAELTDQRNWRSGLRVRLLLRRQFQSKHSYQQAPHQRARKAGPDGEAAVDEEEGVPEKGGERVHDKGGDEFSGAHHGSERGDEFSGGDSGHGLDKKGRGRGRGGRSGGGGRGRGMQGLHHTHSGTPPQNSFYLSSELIGKPPPGPRMPDGTRGFSTGRGKLLAVNTSVNSVA